MYLGAGCGRVRLEIETAYMVWPVAEAAVENV